MQAEHNRYTGFSGAGAQVIDLRDSELWLTQSQAKYIEVVR